MIKRFLAAGLLSVFCVLAASALVAAQQIGPRGALPFNPFQSVLNNNSHKTHSELEHELKSAQKGLNDVDPKVRVEALRKLRDVPDEEANLLLIQSLSDPDARVKIKAIDLLGARQVKQAVPALSQLLFLRSIEPIVKLHVAAALGRIADPRGVKPILEYLGEKPGVRGRGTAVYALGEIGDPSAMAALANAATEDPSPVVRHLASQAMEEIDGELPAVHPKKVAEGRIPTDQRLAKLRKMDAQLDRYEY